MYTALLDPGTHVVHELPPGRSAWLHVVAGEAALGDLVLTTGDGAGFTGERAVSLTARLETEILLLDLCDEIPASPVAASPRESPAASSGSRRALESSQDAENGKAQPRSGNRSRRRAGVEPANTGLDTLWQAFEDCCGGTWAPRGLQPPHGVHPDRP